MWCGDAFRIPKWVILWKLIFSPLSFTPTCMFCWVLYSLMPFFDLSLENSGKWPCLPSSCCVELAADAWINRSTTKEEQRRSLNLNLDKNVCNIPKGWCTSGGQRMCRNWRVCPERHLKFCQFECGLLGVLIASCWHSGPAAMTSPRARMIVHLHQHHRRTLGRCRLQVFFGLAEMKSHFFV